MKNYSNFVWTHSSETNHVMFHLVFSTNTTQNSKWFRSFNHKRDEMNLVWQMMWWDYIYRMCKAQDLSEKELQILLLWSFIIRNMEAGGAAWRLGVLSPTAVVEFGCIRRVVGSQFIVPWINQLKISDCQIKRADSNRKKEDHSFNACYSVIPYQYQCSFFYKKKYREYICVPKYFDFNNICSCEI